MQMENQSIYNINNFEKIAKALLDVSVLERRNVSSRKKFIIVGIP